jgi:hypothetical protein
LLFTEAAPREMACAVLQLADDEQKKGGRAVRRGAGAVDDQALMMAAAAAATGMVERASPTIAQPIKGRPGGRPMPRRTATFVGLSDEMQAAAASYHDADSGDQMV